MEDDKKPCDDIFDGLAELLIKNGHLTHNTYTRSRACDDGVIDIHSRETWSMTYGKYTYLLKAHDGEVDSIQRIREESEDE
jgi:hypothetical protein